MKNSPNTVLLLLGKNGVIGDPAIPENFIPGCMPAPSPHEQQSLANNTSLTTPGSIALNTVDKTLFIPGDATLG